MRKPMCTGQILLFPIAKNAHACSQVCFFNAHLSTPQRSCLKLASWGVLGKMHRSQ